MKIRILIAGLILLSGATVVLAFNAFHKKSTPPDREKLIVSMVGLILKRAHYHPKPIDDAFSKEVFYKYLNQLDPQKNIFLQKDIDELKTFEYRIDDEINTNEPLDFFKMANALFDKRIAEVAQYYPEVLSHPFNFHENDSIVLDSKQLSYPANEQARKNAWYLFLKYKTLDRLVELQQIEEKKQKDSAGYVPKPDSVLEAQARADVQKNMDLFFERIRKTYTEDERFSWFVNAITTTMDPHTEYMPPIDQRYFNEQMSGTFYGIGALLQQEDGKIKIASIVTGGPAWKQGELKAGDIILKVAQGDSTAVDLTGYSVEDAVKLIRGDKNTIVKLTVKHPDGTIKTIAIMRGEVKIDATFAKSYLIDWKGHRWGIINLPEFYAPFNNGIGGESWKDMQKEVNKLKAARIDGIIVDLRFNGGGSLSDAINIAGLFVPAGPVVQVRSGDGHVQILKSHNTQIDYTGPLALMVNEYSASASEIFAAAMQDYKRAVIVGSPSTYGKGTVQRMIDLDDFYSGNTAEIGGPLGSLKITIQKFYRINGGSTQLKGVHSDIILPDNYFNVGESTDSDAMKWDQIAPANYTTWSPPVDVSYLQKLSDKRLDTNKIFHLIEENIRYLKQMDSMKTYPLNIDAYKAWQKQNQQALKRMDQVYKMTPAIPVHYLPVDESYIQADSTRKIIYRDLLRSYTHDPYLLQTLDVMQDMLHQPSLKAPQLTKSN
ncbi:MAG: carboxy terminal-processing peptidase [Thermoflavifilum sp.]|nr:carboxy terminal-processing peptidase [Thermoflavifilum sp.]